MSLTGGYEQERVADDEWIVGFLGNGFTTRETVQTMWLYRCAELTLEKGYAGFEIETDMHFTFHFLSKPTRVAQTSIVNDAIGQAMGNAVAAQAPRLNGTIKLLRAPVTPVPGRVFDAAVLRATLEPLVRGKMCNGNVCPHPHDYLGSPSARSSANHL